MSKAVRFNDNVGETIQTTVDCMVEHGTDRERLHALIDRIAATDPSLALEVEAAANALAGTYTDAAFWFGWECAKDPERLIFAKD